MTGEPGGDVIGTERLLLTPLRPEDADEMVEVLADPRLHEFIGGRPATLEELRERYALLATGSGRPDEVWRNWTVRRRADARPVGTLQATLVRRRGGWVDTGGHARRAGADQRRGRRRARLAGGPGRPLRTGAQRRTGGR